MSIPPRRIDRSRDLAAIRETRRRRTGGQPMFYRTSKSSSARTGVLVAIVALLVVGVLVSRTMQKTTSPAITSVSVPTVLPATTTVPVATATPLPTEVTVQVAQGATWTDVANQLQSLGLIDNAFLFRTEVRLMGSGASLDAGTYTLKRGMNYQQIIAVFEDPTPEVAVNVRFTEGWRSEQMQAELQAKKVAGATDFLSAVKHPPSQLDYPFLADKPADASLEGYLFPDTYQVLQNATASDVITKMLDRFGQVFTPSMQNQARTQGHTIFQVLIVASIVEREAAVPQERQLIAGVYWNRIIRGECMCADPTVQYALGTPQNWWPVLAAEARTLAPDSPYNTYTHLGFPPSPIANPGLASIAAALNPQGDYLYFVAKGDGTHLFAHTLQEQTQNEQKVQQ